MRITKRLSRSFVISYFVWTFGALLCGLLLVKKGGALPIIAFVLAGIDLGLIIAARAVYKKHYFLFFIFSIIGFAILNVLVIGGLILEIVYTTQGIPATYAWVIACLNTALLLLVDYLYIFELIKNNHKRLVQAGVIAETEEDEI